MQHTHVERLTEDRLIYAGPCVLYCINASLLAAQHHIEIYDGMDIVSGHLVQRIEVGAISIIPLMFFPGAEFTRGLYIHISDAGDYCTIVWGTIHESH
jgi:hypothetical protein